MSDEAFTQEVNAFEVAFAKKYPTPQPPMVGQSNEA
jgi:hypothetical protein